MPAWENWQQGKKGALWLLELLVCLVPVPVRGLHPRIAAAPARLAHAAPIKMHLDFAPEALGKGSAELQRGAIPAAPRGPAAQVGRLKGDTGRGSEPGQRCKGAARQLRAHAAG